MRRIETIALILLVVFALGGRFFGYTGEEPPGLFEEGYNVRRPPVIPQAGEALPPPSQRDPAFVIEGGDEQQNSTGTAFSIRASGVWMTARHVVDGCKTVGIITGPRRGMRVGRVASSSRADVSVIWTGRGAPPMPLGGAEDLKVGQKGFLFGFPQGKPADVLGLILGRQVMNVRGRYRTREPVIAWVDMERRPNFGGPLSGASGGPVVDSAGRVVGVAVAASIRRGRFFTAAPRSMDAALRYANVEAEGASFPVALRDAISERNFDDIAQALKRQISVGQVVCLVD